MQGNLYSLIFFNGVIPFASVFRKVRATRFSDNLKISNLMFTGNFIIFSKNEKNFISLLSTGHSVSKDIGMTLESRSTVA